MKKPVNYKALLTERERDLEDRTEELEAQHEELNSAVEALIEKNARLETTLERLNTLNAELDQIVYRSSHDLKSPITSIEGLLTLIETDPSNTEQYLFRARKTVDHMKHVLIMLVRYSSTLSSATNYELIDCDSLWEELLEELKLIEGFDKIRIHNTNNCIRFNCDPAKIKLILYNLIQNSINFRNDTNPKIEVKTILEKDTLKIKVSDNGHGIPLDIQPNVFDMFYRGTNLSNGSGLGLYLCKRSVEILEGKIGLVSSVGVGTTVSIELPIFN